MFLLPCPLSLLVPVKDKGDDESQEVALTALQRLSLQRKSRNGDGRLDGNRNVAKGIKGLHFGGRAGLAKKNLASLAPDFLPGAEARDARTGFEGLEEQLRLSKGNKRPAELHSEELENVENGRSGSSAAPRPSKLAALAAARSSSAKPSASVAASPGLAEASGEGKPLSKLQQKMQANLLARQQKKQTTLSKEDVILQNQKLEEDERSQGLLLPTGEPITSLFPLAALNDEETGNRSSFGAVLRSKDNHDLSVPGGSSFLNTGHDEAFSKPSPDDIVLKAREGTNLAKT